MDMAIRIDNRLFERRQEHRLSYQRHYPVILQQLLSLLTSGINSSNQDFLKPDDLQLQSQHGSFVDLPSATNSTSKIKQSYGYRLCAQRLTVFNGARPSGKNKDFALFVAKLVIAKNPDIDLTFIQRFKYGSRSSEFKKPVLQVSSNTSNRSHSRNHSSRSLSVLGSISDSVTPIPPEINEEFSSVFPESQADILPSHRSFDCTINLSPSAEPSYGRIYQLTREEDKQKDKLRLCMDYRGLNKQTIKDRNPIPLISEMLRTLSIGKIFTTLDLRGAYNLLRIKEATSQRRLLLQNTGNLNFL
ncbi:hypothetical protein BASA83_006313 [Batrachochytrium salamandrivorans]|nr:hypothetical protein BASA83_006313 [Batrachochytrium salamandrivorans]